LAQHGCSWSWVRLNLVRSLERYFHGKVKIVKHDGGMSKREIERERERGRGREGYKVVITTCRYDRNEIPCSNETPAGCNVVPEGKRGNEP